MDSSGFGAFRSEAQPSEYEICWLILSEYLRLTKELQSDFACGASLDSRYLEQFRLAREKGDVAQLNLQLRAYLAACNFGTVHLKIVAHAIHKPTQRRSLFDLLQQVNEYHSASSLT
jgi:hypothetical protein